MTTTQTIDLHWEATGAGAPVLLIPGTPGDGRQFSAVREALADDHLVITYDRRAASVAEQADDAAVVLSQVGVDGAVVFGTSNGAAVALELAVRHPRLVKGLMLHEMPLLSVLTDPGPVVEMIGGVIGPAIGAGGPKAGLEAFLRFAFGDAVVDGWAPAQRDALLADADIIFSVELPAFQAYRPDESALARITAPASVLVGRDQPAPFFTEAAEWLAASIGTTVDRSPGAHGPQFTHPVELAETIRRFASCAS